MIRTMVWLSIVTLAFIGCSGDTATEAERAFVVRIDDVSAPQTVSGDQSFTLNLSGIIGPNLCYHFDRVETTRSNRTAEITVYGKVPKSPGVCATAIAELRNEPVVLAPPFEGPFEVVIHQPIGDPTRITIEVIP